MNRRNRRPALPYPGQAAAGWNPTRSVGERSQVLKESCTYARRFLLFLLATSTLPIPRALSQTDNETCPRPQAGSTVSSPTELRSNNGELRASLSLKNSQAPGNSQAGDVHARYCYVAQDGSQSPTLRLHPGDLLILDLKNDISPSAGEMTMEHPAAQSSSTFTGSLFRPSAIRTKLSPR